MPVQSSLPILAKVAEALASWQLYAAPYLDATLRTLGPTLRSRRYAAPMGRAPVKVCRGGWAGNDGGPGTDGATQKIA